jgi:hypothetical protein
MIKFVVAALWICAATVGAVFYSFQSSGPQQPSQPKPPLLGGLDYVKTQIISVPLIRNSAMQGYFLTKLVITAEPSDIAKLSVPAPDLLTDEVYSYLYGNPMIDFSKTSTLDIGKFRDGIRDSINRRVGIELAHDVIVDQISFLTMDQIRDNAIQRRAKPDPQARPSDGSAESEGAPAVHE